MTDRIDCEHIPECEGEDGCAEQIWTWKQYCSNRDLMEAEVQQEHIPVDAGVVAPWWIYFALGFIAGFLIVQGIKWIIQGIRRG